MMYLWLAAVSIFFLNLQDGAQAQGFSDWSVRCGKDDCAVYAEIRLPNGKLVSSIEIRNFGKKYGGVIRIPLGTYVPNGYLIGIDQNHRIVPELITCRRYGCAATFRADKSTLDAFMRGLKLSVVFTREDTRKPVAMDYSLYGFSHVWQTFLALK